MAIIIAWMLLNYVVATETIICHQDTEYRCETYSVGDLEAYEYPVRYLEGQITVHESEGYSGDDEDDEEIAKTNNFQLDKEDPLNLFIWRR